MANPTEIDATGAEYVIAGELVKLAEQCLRAEIAQHARERRMASLWQSARILGIEDDVADVVLMGGFRR